VILIATIVTVAEGSNTAAEEPPAFFLKIAKSIPRIGRSEPYENMLGANVRNCLFDINSFFTIPI
jgi:hypothetical protein